MRSKHQQRVDEFMRLAQQEVPDYPVTELSEEVRILRAKLMHEEVMETINGGLGVSIHVELGGNLGTVRLSPENCRFVIDGKFDLTEIIDGCADVAVVTTGTLTACGIPDEPFQEEVDNNNLAKFGPGGHRREDGKWIKPPNHQPPRIKELLEEVKERCTEYLNDREKSFKRGTSSHSHVYLPYARGIAFREQGTGDKMLLVDNPISKWNGYLLRWRALTYDENLGVQKYAWMITRPATQLDRDRIMNTLREPQDANDGETMAYGPVVELSPGEENGNDN